MHSGIYAASAWAAVIFFVGRRFYMFWKGGFIGVGIMLAADLLGTRYNLYVYPTGILYLGSIPVLHIIQTYASSILYLNWLPPHRDKRVPYTVLVSALFLAMEAVMHRAGAIIYLNWNLGYSFFLLIAGLLLLSCLFDLVTKEEVREEMHQQAGTPPEQNN